jgi:hypothetical protein
MVGELDTSGLRKAVKQSLVVAHDDFQQVQRTRDDEAAYRFRWRFKIAWAIGSVVFFFVGNIYAQRDKLPGHFAWWDRANADGVVPKGRFQYSMYQVAIASFHQSVSSLLNLLTVWSALPTEGSLCLLQCIAHFETQPRTRGRVGLLHWAGNGEQTGERAIRTLLCGGGNSLEGRQDHIVNGWMRTRDENIFFPFFPDPSSDRDAFFRVPVLRELITASCNAGNDLRLLQLYRGGLCDVARTQSSAKLSAQDIFREFFAVDRAVSPGCLGTFEAAVAGAAVAGTTVLGYGDLLDARALNSAQQAGSASQLSVAGGTMVLSIAGGIAGAYLGAASREEQCDNQVVDEFNRNG